MSSAGDFFTSLLFGEGALIGALLFVCIVILVTAKEKSAGVPLFFVCLFMTIAYFQNISVSSNNMWLSLLMFIISIYTLIRAVKK